MMHRLFLSHESAMALREAGLPGPIIRNTETGEVRLLLERPEHFALLAKVAPHAEPRPVKTAYRAS